MGDHFYTPAGKPRARTLGVVFDGKTGECNNITDVPGVSVGYETLISGEGPLILGKGPVRTGVTAIFPREKEELHLPVFAGFHSLNGNGELTGSHYIEEVGQFSLPVTITNTHSCGVARDATIEWMVRQNPKTFAQGFALPLAAETYDGFLNDINGFHITRDTVFAALDNASSGPIEEGSVGGGTGMKCFGFKAGSGSASRIISRGVDRYTLGCFVQANFGEREDLIVNGNKMGRALHEPLMIQNTPDPDLSSIIIVLATDAPLLPHQLKRLARRATFGIGKVGGIARHGSGDIFIAFSTANKEALSNKSKAPKELLFLEDETLNDFFAATIQATEEAILNSLCANSSMTGRDGNFVPALPLDQVKRRLTQEN